MLKIIPNPNIEKYLEATRLVAENDGYCPCAIIKDNTTKCMCDEFRNQATVGYCHCGRFMKSN